MKPPVQLDNMKEIPIVVGELETTKKRTLSRWVIGAVVVVTSVVVVAATIITSVYLVAKITKDNFKESWITFQSTHGNINIKEKVIVTDRETDISNPGNIRIITDYDGKMKVIQFDEGHRDDDGCVCLISELNDDEEESTESMMKEMIGPYINLTVPYDDWVHTFMPVEGQVDAATLSPRAKEMCFECKLVKVAEKLDEGTTGNRQKRRSMSYLADHKRFQLYSR